jgi:hypothetical protein
MTRKTFIIFLFFLLVVLTISDLSASQKNSGKSICPLKNEQQIFIFQSGYPVATNIPSISVVIISNGIDLNNSKKECGDIPIAKPGIRD